MDSPADYLDSPMEGDDVAYPCKGCGDVRSSRFEVIADGDTDVIHRSSRKERHSNLVCDSAPHLVDHMAQNECFRATVPTF